MKKLFFFFALTLCTHILLAQRTVNPNNYEIYVTIEGTKQGVFKGERTPGVVTMNKDKIIANGFSYEVASPRDAASGQATGKRQHGYIKISKPWGVATPQLFQAAVTGEILKTVLLEFVRTAPTGKEEVFQTIKLTNASVAKIEQTAGILREQTIANSMELEMISFSFQKIEIENKIGKTMAADDLVTGR